MLSERDAAMAEWIGRMGAVGAEHLAERFGCHQSDVYRRLRVLQRYELIQGHRLLYNRPGLYVATSSGLRWQGLGHMGVQRVGPVGFEHLWRVAGAASGLQRRLPVWTLLSERDIRARQAAGLDEPTAATTIAGRAGARPARHRADLGLLSPQGRLWAIEVELSIKAPARLQTICLAWARAPQLAGVIYLAPPRVGRMVGRAIAATRAEERICVLGLDELQMLASAVLAREAGCEEVQR